MPFKRPLLWVPKKILAVQTALAVSSKKILAMHSKKFLPFVRLCSKKILAVRTALAVCSKKLLAVRTIENNYF